MDAPRRKPSKFWEVGKIREDLIQYFYKCMLTCIVDQWEDDLSSQSDNMPIYNKIIIVPNKSYAQVCSDFELQNDSIQNVDADESSRRFGSRLKSTKSKKSKRSKSKKFSSLRKRDILEESPAPTEEDCVIIKFSNGNFYNGHVYKKLFHGKGKFKWSDGSSYDGEFRYGQITGKGKFFFSDQSTYEGEVYQGFPHGYGKKFTPESPSAYCGDWRIGKKHGVGWVIFSEDNWYEGDWRTDKMDGNGFRCYPDGSKYQGGFHKGKRQGNGCAILWNNDFYDGEWVNGKRTGYGEYVWKAFFNHSFSVPVQNKYTGYWLKDCMHGKGELNLGLENGARYIGNFFQNYKHGGGVVICDNGKIIKCDRIFANDKQIHLEKGGEVVEPLHETETCNEHCQRAYDEIEVGVSKDTIHVQTENRRHFELNKKIFVLPNIIYGKENLPNLCQFKFTPNSPKRSTLQLPINATGESINLDPCIRKLYKMINVSRVALKKSDSFTEEPNTWEEVGVKMMSNKKVHYDYQEIYNIEERALRRAIHINLGRLREIYKQYSIIGCLKKLPYDTLMNRLFLWQMYRDCKISEKGISLSRIDVLLAEDSISFSECIHDPFENIYFWQFLTSLVKTAWEIYGNKGIKYMFEGRSILEEIFTKFLKEDIFPNVGHHLGAALFDYKDIIPMRSAYNWYKSIEEPMTVKTFVLNIFSLNKKETCRFEPVPKDFYLKNGKNISIGNQVVFLDEEEPKYCIGPKKEKIHPFAKKCLKKKLYFLREIGPKLIYKKIRSIVPGIFMNKECFNNEYQLCFLEFYEILLVCTQHILRKKDLRFKEQNTKISNVPDKHKTVAPKKSKQYRKSASHHSLGKQRPTS